MEAGGLARSLVAARFADGIRLAELASIQDQAQVPAAVAAMLGVRQAPGAPVLELLAGVLSRQQVLLVLDNCEHVLDAVAQLCEAMLPLADDVRVLATSREPIAVAGEARYRLGPLAVPGLGPNEPGHCTAVELFADRASRVDPGFALDGTTGPVIGQLLDRLDDRFTLLTSSARTAPARQRSLAATVDWSYQLLSDQESRRSVGWPSSPARSAWTRPRRLPSRRRPGRPEARRLLAADAAPDRAQMAGDGPKTTE
jgi:predicted ATPase